MTLRSTLASAIDSANVGITQVYADDAPNTPKYPCAVLRMDPNASNLLSGDSRIMARNRSVSLSIYAEQTTETETIPLALAAALDGYRAAGMKVRVLGWRRVVDQALPVIQWDLDLDVIFWG